MGVSCVPSRGMGAGRAWLGVDIQACWPEEIGRLQRELESVRHGMPAEVALAPRAGPGRSCHDEVPGARRPASQRQLAAEALVARIRPVQQASQRLATPGYLSSSP